MFTKIQEFVMFTKIFDFVASYIASCPNLIKILKLVTSLKEYITNLLHHAMIKKKNLVMQRFSGDRDMSFCAVFDGHGPSGHKVSQYVRDFLPAKISQLYRQPTIDGSPSVMDIGPDDEDSTDPDSRNPLFLSWRARLTKCFHDMDEQLEKDTSVESYCSGTTSVSVLKKVTNEKPLSLTLLN